MGKTIYSAALDYIEYLRVKGHRESTLIQYSCDLEKVYGFFGADNQLSGIDLFHISRFLNSDLLNKGKQDQPLAVRTIDRTIRVFWGMVNWACEARVMEGRAPKE